MASNCVKSLFGTPSEFLINYCKTLIIRTPVIRIDLRTKRICILKVAPEFYPPDRYVQEMIIVTTVVSGMQVQNLNKIIFMSQWGLHPIGPYGAMLAYVNSAR